MLESIGMEKRQIMKMLCIENIYLAIPNILITFAAGGLAGFGTVWAFRKFVGPPICIISFPWQNTAFMRCVCCWCPC